MFESIKKLFSAEPDPVMPAVEPRRNEPCPCGSGKKYKHCCQSGKRHR